VVLFKNQKGFTAVEVLVSLAVLGIVSVGLFSALNNSSNISSAIDRAETGRAIAQSQMEYVKVQNFKASGLYQTNSSLMAQYPGYTVSIAQAPAAPQRDAFIQKIEVDVYFNGKEVATLQDYKVKR
jgi:prepilin-type N-terminal cleavage/methylation domain-containing protein